MQQPPPGLLSARDLAEAAVQAFLALVAATRPVDAWPGWCRRLAGLFPPSGGPARLAEFREALRAVLGDVPDAEAEAIFASRWEGLYRRRMMVVRECVRPKGVRFTWQGWEHLEAARAAGDGAALWAGEFVFATLAGKRGLFEAGVPLHQISSRHHGFRHSRFGNAVLNRLQVAMEDRYLAGRLSFEGRDSGMLIRRAMRLLRSGGFVVFTNNVFGGRSFIQLPLGPAGAVSMSTTPIALALRQEVPLFFVTTIEKEPLAHYEIRVSEDLTAGERPVGEAGKREADDAAVARIAAKARDELLAGLRAAPDQFLNWLPLARPKLPDRT
ncbi:MAG TPA: hypothetical protein VLN73_05925 [Alphaproteobacteria bacterium]|nr:hypothetical protein [Alphaproteobacteria bacterium]